MPKKKTAVRKVAPKTASKAQALRDRAAVLRSSFTGGQRTPEHDKLDIVAMTLEELANIL